MVSFPSCESMLTKKKYRCLAHIINLVMQVLISMWSKAKYYGPHNINNHTPCINAIEWDEPGLIHAISVKASVELFLKYMINNHVIVLGVFFCTA